MDKSRLEIRVGLFVFIGLALLAVLLIELSKGTSLFRSAYTLRLHAANVGGLKKSAGVLLAGVPVGSVSDIQLAGDGKSVTILLDIYKGTEIYHDARFVIEQAGFLGDQYVSIIPTTNSPPLLQNGADVKCQAPFNLQEVARTTSGFIKRIDETAQKLDDSVSELRRVVLNANTLTNFSLAVNNMRTFSEQAMGTVDEINAIIATNAPQAGLAVSNIVFFSQELTRLAAAAGDMLATNRTDITSAVKNIESSTEVLKSMLNDIQAGKGLAGAMLESGPLATNMQVITCNLAIATSNLNRLGLWHFLWHKEPVTTTAGAPQPTPPDKP